MLSVGATRFEDRFCASKKGGIGGGGRVSVRDAVHMAATLAGFRKALVGTGLMPCTWQLPWLAVEKPWSALAWVFLSFLTQTGIDKAPLPF